MDIEKTVKEFKAGKVEVRNDKTGNLHVPIGKASLITKNYLITSMLLQLP